MFAKVLVLLSLITIPILGFSAETETTIERSLAEKDIPVVLDEKKPVGAQGSPIGRAITTVGVLGLLGMGAFFFIKKYGQPKNKTDSATKIKVLSQHYLGPKKSLAIIRVAGESVLIGITDSNINLIKSLALLDEDIPEDMPKTFKVSEEEDDFSIAGIKEAVSTRLKDMRTL